MKYKLTLICLILISSTYGQKILLKSKWLFNGKEVNQGQIVVITENRIEYVGPEAEYSHVVDSAIDFGNATLMPGMIEGHSHVLLYPYDQTSWNDQVLKESRSLRAIRGAKMATKNLMAGFTTIRDLGSEGAGYADVGIKRSIELGITDGPRMIVAGPAIVATGSYGPKGFHSDFDVPLGAEEADGDDLIRVVRDQIGKGADVIKVYADYRWGSNGESRPTFSTEELKLIVSTASSSGRVVVAHANTAEAMRRATLAGVATIEHGTEASLEVLRLMAERNVALCPTLAATESIAQYRGWKKGSGPEPEIVRQKKKMFEMALKSGVRIVAGGDVGVFPHGKNVLELELMVEYGMKPIDVLMAVTSGNSENLDLNETGHLKEGFLADVIAIGGNPVEDIKNLYNVKMVMKDGRIYK